MTDKKKIVLIYAGVAVICVLIVTVAVLLSALKKVKRSDQIVTGFGREEVQVMQTLDEDIKLTRQGGEEVSLLELKDKVWVAAQFYASCPVCAARNANQLLGIYKEFSDNPDFRVVCFSIDPEVDTLEHLKELESALQVDESKWWFVKGDGRNYLDYMVKEMGWPELRERTDPLQIAAKGRWVHDMSLEVYDGLDLVAKVNLEGGDGPDAVAERARLSKAVSEALAKK